MPTSLTPCPSPALAGEGRNCLATANRFLRSYPINRRLRNKRLLATTETLLAAIAAAAA